MFRLFTRNLYSFASKAKPQLNKFSSQFRARPALLATGMASVPLAYYLKNSVFCIQPNQDEEKESVPVLSTVKPSLIENPTTFWEKFKSTWSHIFRFFQLIVFFLPPLLAFPLKMFKITEKIWLKLFVSAVEKAGVVWIKAFQYLSHRRDVIGPEMADGLGHLRENAPQHSYEETEKIFKIAFGKTIEEIFDSFEEVPIASGSVSQVYRGVYKGNKVAVKVRHP